jgi:LysM repeat protein
MNGIFGFLNDLYIKFMVWLGAEPPTGYEHLVEDKPAKKPVPPATPSPPEKQLSKPQEAPVEPAPPIITDEPPDSPVPESTEPTIPPTQLPLEQPEPVEETPEAVAEEEVHVEPEPVPSPPDEPEEIETPTEAAGEPIPEEEPEEESAITETKAEEPLFRYEVQRGDTLNAIARKYGLTVKELLEANELEDPSRIYPGLKLIIPGYMLSGPEVEAPPQLPPMPQPPPSISDQFLYTVASGDTLNAIAKRYGITLRDLIDANTLEDPVRIFVGQKLVIPGVLTPASPSLSVDTDPTFPPVGPLDASRAVYVSYFAAGHQDTRNNILQLLNSSELNAIVIDAKSDLGRLTFPTQNTLANEIGAGKDGLEGFEQFMAGVNEQASYTIARIVVFKDNLLARAHPELAVKTETGMLWVDGKKSGWADPFQIGVWEYNIQLAIEAARFGFNEIQFDVIRFPTSSQAGKPHFAQSATAESRVAAITGFLGAAYGQLEPYKVKVSARVLGYTCWRTDDYVIGQKLERIAQNVDILSPTLYPTTFHKGIPGIKIPVTEPYQVVFQSVQRAVERTRGLNCDIRPWIQDFPDYRFDNRSFTKTEIQAQIKACFDAGASGFMVWNPDGNYTPNAYAPVSIAE